VLTEFGQKIGEETVPLTAVAITTDNARNMVNLTTCKEGGFQRVPCFAHTLQLAIKDGLSSGTDKNRKGGVDRALAKARKLVTHFSHSIPSRNALKNAQLECGMVTSTQHSLQLVQDVVTRWNSQLAMLQRLVKLKDALERTMTATDKDGSRVIKEGDRKVLWPDDNMWRVRLN